MFPALSVSRSVSAYSPLSSSKLKITSVVVAVAVTSDSAITNSGATFLNRISAFIALPSLPCLSEFLKSRVRKGKEPGGPNVLHPHSESAFAPPSMQKSFSVCQNNSGDQIEKTVATLLAPHQEFYHRNRRVA